MMVHGIQTAQGHHVEPRGNERYVVQRTDNEAQNAQRAQLASEMNARVATP